MNRGKSWRNFQVRHCNREYRSMGKQRFYKNNRGSSLIIVITTIALISILASAILGISMMNMQMKAVNNRSIDNFYDAEEAMDEIRIGLQQLASEAAGLAYEKVFESYSVTNNDKELRKTYFITEYKRVLKSRLQSPENPDKCNVAVLQSYIGTNHRYSDTTGVGAALTPQDGTDIELKEGSSTLTIENLKIVFRNTNHYVTTVETDIILQCPDLNFIQPDLSPELLSYVFVANEGIDCNGTGEIVVDGNVYAGKADTGEGFWLEPGSKCRLTEWVTFIVQGELLADRNSDFSTGSVSSVWAKNIRANSGSNVALQGRTYVADNLDIYGGNVLLAGEYYGFGNPVTAANSGCYQAADINARPYDYSSAIQIYRDSAKAALDMSGLRLLMIAGNAYSDKGLMLGESVHVSDMEDMYLAPVDCFYVPESGEEVTNPFGGAASLMAEPAVYQNMYYADGIGEYPDGGLKYYYLQFSDPSRALKYYKSKVSNYLAVNPQNYADIVDKIVAPSSLKQDAMLNGGLICGEGADMSGISFYYPTTDVYGEIVPNMTYVDKQYLWQQQYAAYQKKLTADYDEVQSVPELSERLFDNLINVSVLESIVPGGTTAEFYYEDEVGDRHYAVVANGCDVNLAAYASKDVSLFIVNKGSVTLSSSFEGTIICDKGIQLNSGSSLITCASNVTKASMLVKDAKYTNGGNEYQLLDLLKEPGRYGSYGLASGEEQKIDIADCVTYWNWSKE